MLALSAAAAASLKICTVFYQIYKSTSIPVGLIIVTDTIIGYFLEEEKLFWSANSNSSKLNLTIIILNITTLVVGLHHRFGGNRRSINLKCVKNGFVFKLELELGAFINYVNVAVAIRIYIYVYIDTKCSILL